MLGGVILDVMPFHNRLRVRPVRFEVLGGCPVGGLAGAARARWYVSSICMSLTSLYTGLSHFLYLGLLCVGFLGVGLLGIVPVKVVLGLVLGVVLGVDSV